MDTFIGKMLNDRYEILDLIGYGSMSVVYKAQDHRLGRIVAIKILDKELSENEPLLNEFYTNSQNIAALSHPNIVDIYDINQHQDIHYIVMEYLNGITLKQFIQYKKSLNWNETLYFALRIVSALEYSHAHGVLHRDLKPQNVMIMRDSSVKVMDFSVSHFSSDQNTISRARLESVFYLSPEQSNGEPASVQSDLYALGVMMYEMLTGKVPYTGDSPVAVAIQHVNGKPVAPRNIQPCIPIGIQQITLHAMNADRRGRYNTATGMRKDMETLQKNPRVGFRFRAPVVPAPVAVPISEVHEPLIETPVVGNQTSAADVTVPEVSGIPVSEPSELATAEETSLVPGQAVPANIDSEPTEATVETNAASSPVELPESSEPNDDADLDFDLEDIELEDFDLEEKDMSGEDITVPIISDIQLNELTQVNVDPTDDYSDYDEHFWDDDPEDDDEYEDDVEDESDEPSGMSIGSIIIILLILAIIGVTIFYFRGLILPFIKNTIQSIIDLVNSFRN